MLTSIAATTTNTTTTNNNDIIIIKIAPLLAGIFRSLC